MAGQIEFEGESEAAAATILGDQMADAGLIGVYASGKRIVSTESGSMTLGRQYLLIELDDGSAVRVVGKFTSEWRPKTPQALRAHEALQLEEADAHARETLQLPPASEPA